MEKCGTTGSSAARSSSHRSIIPRKLFREEEGESQATVAEGSHAVLPEEPLELPWATEDTEEGRRNRVEAWISEATIPEADQKDSEESRTIYRDQDVRVRVPKRTSSQVHSTLQRRSDANDRTWGIEQHPGQEAWEKSNPKPRRRSVMSVDLRPKKRLSEASEVSKGSQNSQRHRISRTTSPRKKMDTANSGWEGTNLTYRTARKASLTLQEEMSLMGCVDTPRQGRKYVDVCSSGTPKAVPQRREKAETVYSDWEETNFIYQSARDPNLDPQDEMSLTEYAEFPPISQHERRSDRESYPPRFPGENETSRRDWPSQQVRETPSIYTDPPRAIASYPESRHIIKCKPLSRVSVPDSCRDEDLLRHPSTQVQDTYAETSSTRSARRRPRSPQHETPRREGMERGMGPVRETTRVSGTRESMANGWKH